jgi:hypothetical protein
MSENSAPARFIRLGIRAGYLEAKKELGKRGLDFPSHPLVDKFLMERPRRDGGALDSLVRVKELLAYPRKGSVFERGDIVDAKAGWIIPHSEVPQEAFGERFIGLYIVPEIEESGGNVIVHPKSLVVRPGVVTSFWKGNNGVVDDSTKIPNVLAERKGVERGLRRVLELRRCGGIFGIVRGAIRMGEEPVVFDYVLANIRPDVKLDVVGVPKEQP